MNLTEILKPGAIKVIASASSKKRLLHDIGDLAESAYGYDSGAVIEALMERLERRLWLTVYGVVAVILAQAVQSFLVVAP